MSSLKDKKTEMLTIRIGKKTKAKLQAMADNDRRSLSDYVRIQLEKMADESKESIITVKQAEKNNELCHMQ